MKTIIISDIHNRVYWIEDALSSSILQPYDKVIFLGDYFDDFNDTPEDALRSAEWLKKSLSYSNRIHLYGTHDLWYRFSYNPYVSASGNTIEKERVISSILKEEDWNLLRLYYFDQNFLMTHAGIHPYLISEHVLRNKNIFNRYIVKNSLQLSTQDIIDKIVDPAINDALSMISKGYTNSWLGAGYARGGIQPVGGIIWLDWNLEFEPVPGLNQIVGHTQSTLITEKSTQDSKNYCIDTKNRQIAILENGTFTYIENSFL